MPLLLHESFATLTKSLLLQLIVGSAIEQILKLRQTSTIYFISGIATVLIGCLLNDSVSVGASGAFLGVCGGFVRVAEL